MTPAPDTTQAVAAPGAAGRRPATLARADASPLARRAAARLRDEWLARATWTIGRTGRLGLVGLALLGAAALFLVSTHRPIVAEVDALRADLASARRQVSAAPADEVPDPTLTTRALPGRSEMPAILGQLFQQATRAHLSIDTAKYEIAATTGGGVVRHRIAFPVTGPYPQIRAFIDATLAAMPAVALTDLALERRSIGDGDVEAQIRMTVYTRSTP